MGGMKNIYPGTGITLCPHCDTRFKITEAQLDAPQGMVRCGHCLRVFDARPNYVSDQSDRQLKLPILDEPAGVSPSDIVVLQPMTLAEQVAIVQDEVDTGIKSKRRVWLWAIASLILLPALLAQAVYFFRVDLAARVPALKPALIGYCRLLKCSVPLPSKTDLLSIESSGLETDPSREDQITLHALLRNRAPYTQAYPGLELTLNDVQDKPVARRVFRPADYLPPAASEKTGLLPNHEVSISLHLNTANLKPVGYRLMLITQPIKP
ncbi:MAG: hypothetical protein A2V79_12750 [Betaproteobacteria bacterium RBG_16_56_24]|nr:MAG: hypothetical protein A2V79_12750 [Betaproteobacteria bacterium RBG_16_56_24]